MKARTRVGTPQNPPDLGETRGLRALDQAAGDGGISFQTVCGVFVEGPAAYKGAAIRTKTYVQICVRDPGSILGFFKPEGYDGPEEPAA